MNVLVSITIPGNLHDVRTYCNRNSLADYLLTAQGTGSYVTLLLRMPEAEADRRGLTVSL